MKDPAFYIKKEFYRLLHNNIVVESNVVPVYSLEQPASESDGLYITLAASYPLFDKSKDNFRIGIRFQIDIVNQLLGNEYTDERVESVSNKICEIVIPTPSTHGFIANADFGIVKCDLYDARYLNGRNETNYIVRKYLIFEVLTKQL